VKAEKETAPEADGGASGNAEQRPAFRPLKAMHHLPRGRKAWNPPFMKEWWFWPACIAGLVLLNLLARLAHFLLGG